MKNNATFAYAMLLILGDFVALLAAFSFAYILRVKLDPRPLIETIPARTYFIAFAYVLPLWVIGHAFIGLYNRDVYEKRFTELGRLIVGSFLGILLVIGYDFVSSDTLFPARLIPVYGLLIGFGFLVLVRTLARMLRKALFHYGIGVNNILIIGNNSLTKRVVESLADANKSGSKLVGLVGKGSFSRLPNFLSLQDAIKKLGVSGIDGIIQTELYSQPEKNSEILTFAQTNHISYRFAPGNSDLFYGNIDVELFASDLPVIAVHQTALIGWGRILKRIFDITFSLVVLSILSPLIALVALLIKAFDPGPVFFRQKRITRYDSPFMIIKFRTMKTQYSGMTPEEAFSVMGKPELSKLYRENGDCIDNDPRMTPLGRFLRNWSLDELPQFINVLRGDISIVGPRALIPDEIRASESKHHIVSVKSGITGLAQVSGRRDISYEERRNLDVYYVQNWSFWLDLVIIFKTLRSVLARSGAK